MRQLNELCAQYFSTAIIGNYANFPTAIETIKAEDKGCTARPIVNQPMREEKSLARLSISIKNQ